MATGIATAPLQQADEGGCAAREDVDRRIMRSKRALRRALIELASERGLDNFTVNEIGRAHV